IDSYTPVTDGAPNMPPRIRATSWAKLARLWKRAKAQLDSESDLSEIEEETCMDPENPSDTESDNLAEDDDPREHNTPQSDSCDMELK
ncbi:Hypothetical predicted protein, partial [Pelobates cultripes]